MRGLFLYGLIEGAHTERSRLNDIFMLAVFGKAIGFPGLFNYYHLKLVPYYIKSFNQWKRRVLKERDFFDHIED